ncbi:glycosyltransferase family 2 protein [Rubrobacter indicoceani]|uniref:glycosyltransferase family 2 protein n=1 Tax=Rubrobacter indicoceani TaxID=2051957 RepID=UPI000E5BA93E|nr:glycosyltransferase family 2 protein [Rubrobacter indicoceani]
MKTSVVIPTLNAGPEFDDLLGALYAQHRDFDLEVLIIDSGSDDGTPERAGSYGARVCSIPKSEFNHGATRNLGVSLTDGEFVVMLVQDAVPCGPGWLASLVGAVSEDGRVAGAYSRQVARPDADPVTRALLNGRASGRDERREQRSEGGYGELPPAKKRRLAAFDNVSSCLRRSVWEGHPFETERFGEDIRWGKAVVEAGYTIVYEPRSVVVHSHERGALYDLKRYYADAGVLAELFELRSTKSLPGLFRNIAAVTVRLYPDLVRDERVSGKGSSFASAHALLLALGYAVVSQVGSYLGANSGRIRKASPKLYARLDALLGRGV